MLLSGSALQGVKIGGQITKVQVAVGLERDLPLSASNINAYSDYISVDLRDLVPEL